MKITKKQLLEIIMEEICEERDRLAEQNPLSGPTAAAPKKPDGLAKAPGADPLSGPTAVEMDAPTMQSKARAFDQVEAMLLDLVKRMKEL
jgi:hypothetical protein